jgi:hypothetical protein
LAGNFQFSILPAFAKASAGKAIFNSPLSMQPFRPHIIKKQVLELRGLREEDAPEMQDRMRRLYYNRLLPLIDRYLSLLSPDNRSIRIEKLELDLGRIDALDFEAAILRQLEKQLQAQWSQLVLPNEASQAENRRPPEKPEVIHWERFRYFVETGNLPWWTEIRPGANPVMESLDYLLEQDPAAIAEAMRNWLPKEYYLRRLARQLPVERLLRLAGLQIRWTGGSFAEQAQTFYRVLPSLASALNLWPSRFQEETGVKLLQIAFWRKAVQTNAQVFWQEWLLQLAVVFKIKYRVLLENLQSILAKMPAETPPGLELALIVRRLVTEQLPKTTATPDRQADSTIQQSLFKRLEKELLQIHHPASPDPIDPKTLQALLRRLQDILREEMTLNSADSDSIDAKTIQVILKRWQDILRGEIKKAPADRIVSIVRQVILDWLEEQTRNREQASSAARMPKTLSTVFEWPAEAEALEDQPLLEEAFRRWQELPSDEHLAALSQVMVEILRENERIQPILIKKWAAHLEIVLAKSPLSGQRRREATDLLAKLQAGALGPAEITRALRLMAEEPGRAAREAPQSAPGATYDDRPGVQRAMRTDVFSQANELFIANAGLVILWPYLSRFFQSLNLVGDKQFVDDLARHRAAGLLQYLADGLPDTPEFLLGFNKILCGLPWDEVLDFGEPITEEEKEECDFLLQAVIANAPILKNMKPEGFRGTFLLRKGMIRPAPNAWQLYVERESYDVVLEKFPWSWKVVKLPWLDRVILVEW